ncbi:MAG: mechanosensitive ion channel family protein [Candidatus Kapaibacterium sp.]
MTKKIIIYCLFLLSAYLIFQAIFVFAQSGKSEVDLTSPHNTIHNHLFNLQKDNYKPELSAKSLNSSRIKLEEAEELSIKLKRIFDGRGLLVEMDAIPDEPNYLDSVTMQRRFFPFPEIPEIYVEKYGSKWLYSIETVRHINDLYKSTFPLDTFSFIGELPEFLRISIFDIFVWQIIALLLTAGFCYLLFYLFYWVFGYLLVKLSEKYFKHKLYLKYIKPVSKPLSLFLIFWVFSQMIVLIGLPIKISYYISLMVRAVQPILITIIIFRLSEFVVDIFSNFAEKTSSTIDDQLVPFFSKVLKVVIVILGILYFFNNVGIDITPLLAGVSIGGLAFALAAQDTVKNLFGSLTIFTDQPFQIGDWIVFDGTEGTVEEVGIRSTRIRTFYNSLISVPNGKLADAKIDNMGRRQYRRYVSKISVTYDTSPELIDAFVAGLRMITDKHPNTRKDYYQIHLNELADSAIQILFYIFFDTPDWTAELEARHEVISEIIKLAEHLGVDFALPTQTIHVAENANNLSNSSEPFSESIDSKKLLENYEPFKIKNK